MDNDGLKARRSGSWAKRKHHYLRRYCDMFTSSMKKKWRTLNYLDLMAGPGVCHIEDTDEYIPGSPFVAIEHPFTRFVFIEDDRENASALRTRVAAHPKSPECQVVQGRWDSVVFSKGYGSLPGLTLAFVDPTGISQVPWTAMQRLAMSSQHIDILMTIQHGMGISLNVHQYLAKEGATAADEFVGDSLWRTKVSDKKDALEAIFERYTEKMAGLGFSTRKWVAVKNDKGTPLYYLCLFARHTRALQFWDQVVLKDELGQRSFNL